MARKERRTEVTPLRAHSADLAAPENQPRPDLEKESRTAEPGWRALEGGRGRAQACHLLGAARVRPPSVLGSGLCVGRQRRGCLRSGEWSRAPGLHSGVGFGKLEARNPTLTPGKCQTRGEGPGVEIPCRDLGRER